MQEISLSGGDSYRIDNPVLLDVEVFSRGADEDLSLVIEGNSLSMNPAGPRRKMILDCPDSAVLKVQPRSGDVFGPDAAVSLTLSSQGGGPSDVKVEFPVVRIDGQAEVTLGHIHADGADRIVSAVDSSSSQNLNREAMTVLSALHDRLGSDLGISEISIHVDATAATTRLTKAEQLDGAVDLVNGVASALGVSSVSLNGQGLRGSVNVEDVTSTIDKGRTEVAQSAGSARQRAGQFGALDSQLQVHITATPRVSMMSPESPSVILVTGADSDAEVELMEPGKRNSAGLIAVNQELIDTLNDGDQRRMGSISQIIADAIHEHPSRKGE